MGLRRWLAFHTGFACGRGCRERVAIAGERQVLAQERLASSWAAGAAREARTRLGSSLGASGLRDGWASTDQQHRSPGTAGAAARSRSGSLRRMLGKMGVDIGAAQDDMAQSAGRLREQAAFLQQMGSSPGSSPGSRPGSCEPGAAAAAAAAGGGQRGASQLGAEAGSAAPADEVRRPLHLLRRRPSCLPALLALHHACGWTGRPWLLPCPAAGRRKSVTCSH